MVQMTSAVIARQDAVVIEWELLHPLALSLSKNSIFVYSKFLLIILYIITLYYHDSEVWTSGDMFGIKTMLITTIKKMTEAEKEKYTTKALQVFRVFQ